MSTFSHLIDQNLEAKLPFSDVCKRANLDAKVKKNKIESNNWYLRCKKVRLKFDSKQLNIITKWFEIYRQVYNYAVAYINTKGKDLYSTHKARDKIKPLLPIGMYKFIKKWKVPSHTIDNAIFDVIKAKESATSNLCNGNIKYFRLRPKKKSKNKQTIVLEASAFKSKNNKNNTICKNTMGPYVDSNNYPLYTITHDCRLTWNKGKNAFILFVPEDRQEASIEGRIEECSLDPGLRTFQTLYDSKGQHKSFGRSIAYHKLWMHIKYINKNKQYEGTKWYTKMRKRRYNRIEHIVDDLHWKTSKYLCTRYDTIYIGKLDTQKVISKKGRLVSKTRILLQMLSHFTFRQRLMSKAEEHKCKVIVVPEHYTTKTCGRCGNINHNVGAKSIFMCPICNLKCSRDLNGARNIMIKGKMKN